MILVKHNSIWCRKFWAIIIHVFLAGFINTLFKTEWWEGHTMSGGLPIFTHALYIFQKLVKKDWMIYFCFGLAIRLCHLAIQNWLSSVWNVSQGIKFYQRQTHAQWYWVFQQYIAITKNFVTQWTKQSVLASPVLAKFKDKLILDIFTYLDY